MWTRTCCTPYTFGLFFLLLAGNLLTHVCIKTYTNQRSEWEHEQERKDAEIHDEETILEKTRKREAAIKGQEEELISLRKAVAEAPIKLEKEVERAVTDAIQRTEMKRSQEIELLKRDSESDNRIAELKIKTLEESLLRGMEQIAAMQAQVNDAKKQVQDIAVKAIEGASGSKTLQFAMEQAQARTASA